MGMIKGVFLLAYWLLLIIVLFQGKLIPTGDIIVFVPFEKVQVSSLGTIYS